MFKRILFITLSLVMVFSLSAFAGEGSDTVGGGKLLPQLRYGYSVSDWDTVEALMNGFVDWDVNTHSYYLQVNWGILENVELVGLVGGQSLSMESDRPAFSDRLESGWAPMFMWGLGVRATFFRADNGLYVGGGALFTHSFSRDFVIDQYDTPTGEWFSSYDVKMNVYRLTPELHAGWHIGDTGLTPYIGVDYTWLKANSDWVRVGGPGNVWHTRYHLDDPVYLFVGLDHYINDRLYLNVEGRTNFNNGWGLETGIGYMFDICAKPAPAPAPAPAPVIEPKLEPMSKN
jgi:hypothetical protein